MNNGTILMALGAAHTVVGVSPWAFGEQYLEFAGRWFFRVSEGVLEFPLFNGTMRYANFAAFWFSYYGLLLLATGLLLREFEQAQGYAPKSFAWVYLGIVCLGVYMIPLSGMTFLMLPHAAYLFWRAKRQQV
ncbi:MAG: DUF6463 family protein [Bacteroidota bacterium]